MIREELDDALKAIVGPSNILTGQTGGPGVVVRPGNTRELSDCLKLIHAATVPLVTLGGMTGLVHGTSTPPHFYGLSTERLNRIEHFDPSARLLLVGAGTKLETVHAFAEEHRLRYGVDFGARGSCSIGGTISTNAGGNSVLRFGMTRANVAGLEVVLADGTVLDDLRGLPKNNAGYDLKQMFIGAEGTLGIVTRALLKLTKRAAGSASLLVAVESLERSLEVKEAVETACGNAMLALEIMWNRYYKKVSDTLCGDRPPLPAGYPIYLLVQVEGMSSAEEAVDLIANALADTDAVLDSALATTPAQEKRLWSIRDGSDVIENAHTNVLSFDVSMRPERYAHYIAEVEAALSILMPDAVAYYFGHLADGNVHFMIGHDHGSEEVTETIERCVYDPLSNFQPSSISAEHGIGTEKSKHLWRSRSDDEINVMNRIRLAIDPERILNPHIQFEQLSGRHVD